METSCAKLRRENLTCTRLAERRAMNLQQGRRQGVRLVLYRASTLSFAKLSGSVQLWDLRAGS